MARAYLKKRRGRVVKWIYAEGIRGRGRPKRGRGDVIANNDM